jgi:serine protease Do
MVMSLTPELRKYFGVPQDRGVLVARVEPGSPAAAAGVAVGDVIVEVRGHKIDTAFDVLSAIAEVGKGEHAQIGLVRDRASRSFDATLADDAAATAWPGTWLRDFAPFHEPSWFRDMSRPPREAPKPQTGTPKTSKPA